MCMRGHSCLFIRCSGDMHTPLLHKEHAIAILCFPGHICLHARLTWYCCCECVFMRAFALYAAENRILSGCTTSICAFNNMCACICAPPVNFTDDFISWMSLLRVCLTSDSEIDISPLICVRVIVLNPFNVQDDYTSQIRLFTGAQSLTFFSCRSD